MFDVENVPAELLLLSGTRLCAGAQVVSVNVGFFGQAFLRNAGGTGVVARLLEVSVFSPTPANIHFGLTENSSVAVGGEFFMDGRVFGEGTTLKMQENNNFGSAAPVAYRKRNDGVVDTVFQPPVAAGVITPGIAFVVGPSVIDVAINVSWLWIERVAQPSELNL